MSVHSLSRPCRCHERWLKALHAHGPWAGEGKGVNPYLDNKCRERFSLPRVLGRDRPVPGPGSATWAVVGRARRCRMPVERSACGGSWEVEEADHWLGLCETNQWASGADAGPHQCARLITTRVPQSPARAPDPTRTHAQSSCACARPCLGGPRSLWPLAASDSRGLRLTPSLHVCTY